MIAASFFFGTGLVAFAWSFILYRRVYDALIDTFPLELRDPHTSRFALHVFALNPSTPRTLQADFVKSEVGICITLLAGALSSLLFGIFIFGWGLFFLFLGSLIATIKSCMIYKANFNRRTSYDDGES